jgi:FixJ family two-component response regulator
MGWTLEHAAGRREAYLEARPGRFGAVFSEAEFGDGGWWDIQAWLAGGASKPPLIVASRLADLSLWLDVLEAGGLDVLATPFDRAEVHQAMDRLRSHKPPRRRRVNRPRLCRTSAFSAPGNTAVIRLT